MSCILLSQALLSKKPLYPATIKKSSLFNQVLQLLNPGERLEKAEEHSLVLVFNTVLLVPLNQHFMPTALMGKWNADKIQPKLNQLSRGLDTSIDTLTPRTLDKVQDFVSQVIYPDMGHIVMLIRDLFSCLWKNGYAKHSLSKHKRGDSLAPALQQVWKLKKGKKSS